MMPITFWIRIDPVGCVTGSVYPSDRVDTPEAAHKEFTSRVRDRRRVTAEGYRHELVGHDEWRRRAKPCLLGRCDHHCRTS